VNEENASGSDSPDLTHLVRSVQRIEGNTACFATVGQDCQDKDCAWRELCKKQVERVQLREKPLE
jgi:hypothetical protein